MLHCQKQDDYKTDTLNNVMAQLNRLHSLLHDYEVLCEGPVQTFRNQGYGGTDLISPLLFVPGRGIRAADPV